MKDFKKLYYIENTPWKRKLDIYSLERFNIKYKDILIFHFNFITSLYKVNDVKLNPDKQIFLSAINICLRYYQIIKKLYPYNKLYVIIYTRKDKISRINIDYDTFKSIIDLIPYFAIVNNLPVDNQENFKLLCNPNGDIKHIFYGFSDVNIKNISYQKWNLLKGKLYITT